jgi:hypothetical protein
MIYTFYSYKGGVGRSMALANVAEYLYRKGLKVVIIDWDLEAPGLESFFYDPKEKEGEEQLSQIRSQLGLIDLLLTYKRHYLTIDFTRPPESTEKPGPSTETSTTEPGSPETSTAETGTAPTVTLTPAAPPPPLSTAEEVRILEQQLPPIKSHMHAIHEPGSLKDKPNACLWLIPAGWREGARFSGYSQAVQSFDWADLYINYKAKVYFEWLRKQLEDVADVILIDSRTGVTEMGGVCTRQLADVVVSFTVLNNQNIEGVAKMMKSFKRKDADLQEARNNRPIETMVVPTRIEASDLRIRAGLFKDLEKQVGEVPFAFREAGVQSYRDLAIPYVSTYAYFEKLAIGGDDDAFELEKAYTNLTTHLVLFAEKDSPIRASFSKELDRKFDISYSRVPQMAPTLPDGFVGRDDVLDSLERLLLTPERGRAGVNVALCGPAGSGKSAVATAFARKDEVAAAFDGGILWATLGVNPDILQQLSAIHFALTGVTQSFSNVDEVCKVIADRLTDKRCLVVVDDVWGLDDLKPFLKLGNFCSYLITTRDPMLPVAVNASPITISGLTPDEALTFFHAQVKSTDQYQPALLEVTRRSGGLPLTLKLMAAALRLRIEGVEDDPERALEYVSQRLNEKGIIAFDREDATERNQSVARSIADSLNLLNEKERERYIRVALLLDNTQLSFEEVSRLWGGDKLETEEERRQHALETEESLQRLHALSLLEYNAKEKSVRLNTHLRAYILSQLPANVGLDIKAERAFAGLSRDEQTLAQRLFTRLVRVAPPDGADTRARVNVKYLGESAQKLVRVLTDAGILVEELDKLTGEQKLQLADESVIQNWGRLRKWIDEDREFLLWRQQIKPSVSAWDRGNRDAYLRGEDLAPALRWQSQRAADLTQSENAYIESSLRSNRRQRVGMIVTLLIVAAVFVLSLLWLWSRQRAAQIDESVNRDVYPPITNTNAVPLVSQTNTGAVDSGNANSSNTNAVASNTNAAPAARPQVFLQFNDQNDRKVVSLIQQDLNSVPFNTPPPEYIGGKYAPEVRYFYPEDIDNARNVKTVVEGSLIKAGYSNVNFLVSYERRSPKAIRGQIEVWIPSLAPGGANVKD